MAQFDFDIVVIGGGAAGITAAKTAHGFGKKVAIVEKKRLGGECTWTGCVPSKTLIKSAEVCYHAKKLSTYGMSSDLTSIDTSSVMKHVRSAVQKVYQTHTPESFEEMGISVIFGSPQFVDAFTILVDGKKICAKKYILATGSSPFVPPIDGIEGTPFLTNETLFDLKKLPSSMIILGGGPIGTEMASALNRLGVTVTLVEMADRILSHEDAEVSGLLAQMMQDEGVQLYTSTKAEKVEKAGDQIIVTVSRNGTNEQLTAQTLLIATGRKPNLDGLELEKAGITTTKNGVVTDATMRTSAANIYASGDIVGPYQFSHMAWHQAVTAVRNACIPLFKKKLDYAHRIWVTFTAPELAAAGLTEAQAREAYGNNIQVYRQRFQTVDRGMTDGSYGLVKVITDAKGYILGAHILGERAGDIIHELQLAKARGVKLHELQSIIHAYPTYAELNWHISKQAYKKRLEDSWVLQLLKKLFM